MEQFTRYFWLYPLLGTKCLHGRVVLAKELDAEVMWVASKPQYLTAV